MEYRQGYFRKTGERWGTKVIDRMSKDLKTAFPEMSGFSPRNIKYMRKFAQCWVNYEIVQRSLHKYRGGQTLL